MELFPTAIKVRDWDEQSLLHIASKNWVSETVILKLMESGFQFPAMIKVKDQSGEHPLHIACRRQLSETVILKLNELFPTAIKVKFRSGEHPLHFACEKLAVGSCYSEADGVVSKSNQSEKLGWFISTVAPCMLPKPQVGGCSGAVKKNSGSDQSKIYKW
jgi:hypothetical protein